VAAGWRLVVLRALACAASGKPLCRHSGGKGWGRRLQRNDLV
jgi:hypothetical protein